MEFSDKIKAALREGDIEFLKSCIDRKNISAVDDKGRTLLHYAVRYGKEDTVKFLLTEGANINALTEDLETPLNWAVFYEKKNIVELLLLYGANRAIQDKDNHEPIYYARSAAIQNLLRPLGEIDTDNLLPSDFDILYATASNRIMITGDSNEE